MTIEWPLVHYYSPNWWVLVTDAQRRKAMAEVAVGDMLCVKPPINDVYPFPVDRNEYLIAMPHDVMPMTPIPEGHAAPPEAFHYVEFRKRRVVDVNGRELYAWERIR